MNTRTGGAARTKTGSTTPAPTGATGRQRLWVQSIFVLVLLLQSAGLVLWLRSGFVSPPASVSQGPLVLAIGMAATTIFAVVGLVIALRRPEVRIGQLELTLALMLAIRDITWGYLSLGATPQGAGLAAQATVALLTPAVVSPAAGSVAVLVGLIFPTDQPLGDRWRLAGRVAIVGAVMASLGVFLRPGPITFFPGFDNPFGAPGLLAAPHIAILVGYGLLTSMTLVAGGALLVRYRLGDATTRPQLRIFAAAGTALAMTFTAFISLVLLDLGASEVRELLVGAFVVTLALSPLAVLFSIARYRLYAIDELVGRTFVFGALAAILAGVYAASMRLIEALLIAFTGETSDAALVITTLVLVTTFTPVKNGLERVVARWKPPAPAPGATNPAAAALTDAQRAEIRALVAEEMARRTSQRR